MAGRRYWNAIATFRDALQGAIARVSTAILLRDGPFPPGDETGHLRLSNSGAALGRGGSDLSFSIALRFRVEPVREGKDRWQVQIFAYSYLLFHKDREIVAYHWDPEAVGERAVLTPHVHFGKDLSHPDLSKSDRDQLNWLASAHWPTGPIPFTALFRAAIRDLGVLPMPLQGEDAAAALASTELSFSKAETALMGSFAWWNHNKD